MNKNDYTYKKKDITIKYLDDNLHLVEEDIEADDYDINENIGFLMISNMKIIDSNKNKYSFEDRYIRLDRIKEFSIRYEN